MIGLIVIRVWDGLATLIITINLLIFIFTEMARLAAAELLLAVSAPINPGKRLSELTAAAIQTMALSLPPLILLKT